MASFFASSRLNFGGSKGMTAAPTWSFGAPEQGTSFSTFSSSVPATAPSFGPSTTGLVTSFPDNTSSSKIQEQFDKSLVNGVVIVAVTTNPTGPSARKLKDASTILDGSTNILRIYLPFEKLPLDWLEGVFLHFRHQDHNPLREVHLCIRSLLRPCLQDIDEDPQLAQALISMTHQWMDFNTSLKFFFLRPNVEVTPGRDRLQTFHEKDLLRAIDGLAEHTVELSEILGEESCLFGQPMVSGGSRRSKLELEDELL